MAAPATEDRERLIGDRKGCQKRETARTSTKPVRLSVPVRSVGKLRLNSDWTPTSRQCCVGKTPETQGIGPTDLSFLISKKVDREARHQIVRACYG